MNYIIKSNHKTEKNWEGKAFSENLPCKIYNSIDDCMDALKGYWFNDCHNDDNREVIIKRLTEIQVYNLLLKRKIRY